MAETDFILPAESDIRLVMTCPEFPEQYEAFIGDKQVGYLRMRHGVFRVDFPDCGGETIYETDLVRGEGCFDDDERELFLDIARRAIIRRLQQPADGGTPQAESERLR